MKQIKALLVIIFAAFAVITYAEAQLGEDGLHKAEWMNETFKDLREDLADANAEGKTLMVIWEQRGCIYCDKMHKEVFVVPDIEQMLYDEFYVVQYNLFGDVEITDFDGEVLSEREMAMKWGVMFTPNLMFFPDEVPEDVTAPEAAIANMPGAFGKWTMRNLMLWVRERGYETGENFQKYHAGKIQEARDAGELGNGE